MFNENLGFNGNQLPSPSSSSSYSSSSSWSRMQDKQFEKALVVFPEETPDRWQKIATQVPGKTPMEVWEHYQVLVHDLSEIEAGRVELPNYEDDLVPSNWDSELSPTSQISFGSNKTKQSETERKKGVPWTEQEHRAFLIGLQKYGKGDWRSISRNAVQTRTPTQVASHAQKYFLRLSAEKKERKRSSIHDITTVENTSIVQPNSQDLHVAPSNGPVQPTLMDPIGSFPGQGDFFGHL
ncbi:SANT/Myb domain [Macleaya cordata]|uniref:SANT/Myb domain n=1 Tax=Macleaya cordata TaxID=56857 RepID=A0A200Q6Q3_MACCD|nr:SANT/Myb domain [Macleaya cordata]